MPSVKFKLTTLGMEFPVLIGFDQVAMRAHQTAGTPIPKPFAGSALVDTGSDLTCVSASLLQQIGSVKIASHSTQTISGRQYIDIFSLSLSIPSRQVAMFVVPTLIVMQLPTAIPNIDVLFGMDLLCQLRTMIDGPKGEFEFHY